MGRERRRQRLNLLLFNSDIATPFRIPGLLSYYGITVDFGTNYNIPADEKDTCS